MFCNSQAQSPGTGLYLDRIGQKRQGRGQHFYDHIEKGTGCFWQRWTGRIASSHDFI